VSCFSQKLRWCTSTVKRRDCVKKTRKRHAVRKMKEGPSKPPCRGRLQTAISCFGRESAVVNVMVKRRAIRARQVWIREMSASYPLDEASKLTLDDTKTGVFTLLWERHGGYLLTGHVVSGVEKA